MSYITKTTTPDRQFSHQRGHSELIWIVLILLTAAALRMVALTTTPPGMTHDEADHGITAWSIVNGVRDIYFTIGYGREPLYDYATALVMAGTGPTIFAARLTSVYFSLLLIAAVFAWTRRAFGSGTGLLAAAGLAVGFWPVMAGRQALRSIALPALFAVAVLFFWQSFMSRPTDPGAGRRLSLFYAALAGLFLGLSFYTYIPARVMWLALPALVLYLWLTDRLRQNDEKPKSAAAFRALGLTLLTAAIVALPLFIHLAANPGLEVRIDELSAPLRAAAAGDFAPLFANAVGSLRLFTIEGDPTWRYNLPGKPFLGTIPGFLFYGGLLVALWLAASGLITHRWLADHAGFGPAAAPGAFLALVWLGLGLSPVLVTGPALSMTQAIGLLPVLYLIPALVMVAGYNRLRARFSGLNFINTDTHGKQTPAIAPVAAALLATGLSATMGLATAQSYFGRWANHPEVRVQYESTMVAALDYLNGREERAAAISTITPNWFHTPAVATLTLNHPSPTPRWFDARQSLLVPDDADSLLLIPGFTPPAAAFEPYLDYMALIDEIPMRSDDLDRPVRVYALDGPAVAAAVLSAMATSRSDAPLPVRFGDHLELIGYDLPVTIARPGDTVPLTTAWRLRQPLPGAMLFAHVVGEAEPVAQADSLGAPGESWVAGDLLLNYQAIVVPPNAPAGTYPVAVGVYTQPDGQRLAVQNSGDLVQLGTLTITDE